MLQPICLSARLTTGRPKGTKALSLYPSNGARTDDTQAATSLY